MRTKAMKSTRLIWTLALGLGLVVLSLALLAGMAQAQTGSISGMVTYHGGLTGPLMMSVGVFADTSGPPMTNTIPSASGNYAVTGLVSGTYYVNVFIDANGSGGPPDPGDVVAWYDPDEDGSPDAVTVADVAVTGIDIAAGGPWLPLDGPRIPGGDVRALAVHPAVSGTLYAAVQAPDAPWEVSSRIYRSTDGGASWMAIYTASHRIAGLAVADTTVYAGAYNNSDSTPYPMVYRSTDGGLSWTAHLSVANGVLWALDVRPTLTQTAIAGGGDYPDKAMLYQTANGGDTWTEVFSYTNPGWYPTVNAALIHPTTPLTWLLSYDGEVDGTWGAYIRRSTDGGANWTEVYSITEDIVTSLVANPVTPTTIYAGTDNRNFYRSNDGGVTWTAVFTDGSVGRRLALDPPNTLYANSSNWGEVLKSTDGGDTWGKIGDVPGEIRALAIDFGPTPAVLYAGLSVRGVHRSTDGGVNWEARHNGMGALVLPRDIDADPQNLDRLFVAAGIGQGWMTANGGATWTQPSGLSDQMGAFAINPEDPNIVYGGSYDCQRGAVLRSEDGGLDFEPVYTATFIAPDCSAGDEVILALAVAPSMSSTVYAAGADHPNWGNDQAVIVRCLNDGASCTEVFTRPADSRVEALAIDPADDDVVYAGGEDCSGGSGCEGFVYRTTNGGGDWTLVFTSTRAVRSIVVDPRISGVVYASDQGYRVYKSSNGGDNWTAVRRPPWEGGDISGDLLAADPRVSDRVYLAGWGYVGESTDGGQTWSGGGAPIDQGDPEMAPSALIVDNGAVTQTLYAGYNGVWAYQRKAPSIRIHLPLVLRNA